MIKFMDLDTYFNSFDIKAEFAVCDFVKSKIAKF